MDVTRRVKSVLLLMALLAGTSIAGEQQRQIDEWVRQAAVGVVTRESAEGKVKHWLRELVDETLHEAGVASDQAAGVLLRTALSFDTRGEIVTAVIDGDKTIALEKTATYLGGALAEAKGVKHVGDVMDVGFEGLNEKGTTGDRLLVAYKATLKKIFTFTDASSKFAALVQSCADIWTRNDLEDAYLKQYKPKIRTTDGVIDDDDWGALYATYLRGSSTAAKIRGMDENVLREHFRQRAVNEKKIPKVENELQRLTEVWKKLDLLDSWRFPKNMEVATRLKQLYDNREMLRRMLTRGGRLMKGEFANLSDREFLDFVTEKWYGFDEQGNRDRSHAKFYAWLKSIGIPPSPETLGKPTRKGTKAAKPTHRWVLVSTDVDKSPSLFSGDDRFDYEATANRHVRTYRVKGKSVSAVSTCSKPPAAVDAGTEVSLELKLTLDGIAGEFFSDYVRVGLEGPDARLGDDPDKSAAFTDASGAGTFTVDQEGEVKQNATVSGTLPAGASDHERRSICFRSKSCLTRWVYEWKPLDEPPKKPDAEEKKEKKPAPTIEGGVARVAEEWHNGFLKVWCAFSGGLISPKAERDGSGPYTRRAYSGIVRPGETVSLDGRILAGASHTAWDEWNKISISITGQDPMRNLSMTKKGGARLPSLSGSYVVSEHDSMVTATIYGFTEWWHPVSPGNDGVVIKVNYKVVK